MVSPDVYDPRLQATKPGLGQFADLKLTAAGSMFGPVGTGIGLAADITKNALAYKNQMNQYNQALSKNKFINSNMPMLPDYTQFMANGGMAEQTGMPVLQNNEIALMPQPDGSWKKVMQTSPNAPTHAEGGVPAPNLPAGAVVFPGQYVQQIEQALQAGDFQSISQMAQQVLQQSQQAKEQGQPYSSGGGGQLPPQQQMQAQQQMPADMMQQQPAEQMPFQGMRCGGMVKHYGNGGMVLPPMMQSDDYSTQKANFEATQAADAMYQQQQQEVNQPVKLRNPNDYQNPADNTATPIYDKNGNIVNFKEGYNGVDPNYYSQSNKDKRNEEWRKRGKPNPDAEDSKPTVNQSQSNTTQSNTTQNSTAKPNDAQDRNVTRQQATKVYWHVRPVYLLVRHITSRS